MTGVTSGEFHPLSNEERHGNYQPAPKRVLVAVDDDGLRRQINLALTEDRHTVVELADGYELLDYLYASRLCQPTGLDAPDAIVAELSLPGISGLQVLGLLRARGVETPFIGLAHPKDRVLFAAASGLGVAFIFEAPLSLADLRAALFSLPGGVFQEGRLGHASRVEACGRGQEFLQPEDPLAAPVAVAAAALKPASR